MWCTCSSNQIMHTMNKQGPQMKWEQAHPLDWHQDLGGCVCAFVCVCVFKEKLWCTSEWCIISIYRTCFSTASGQLLNLISFWSHNEWQSGWVSISHTQTYTAPPTCWLFSCDRYTSFPHQIPDNEMMSRPVDTMNLCKTVNKTRLFFNFLYKSYCRHFILHSSALQFLQLHT